MEFDSAFKSNSDGLPPALAARKDELFYSRRAAGMNVQFIREDGRRDEWSFATRDRAMVFAESVRRSGRDAVISR